MGGVLGSVIGLFCAVFRRGGIAVLSSLCYLTMG